MGLEHFREARAKVGRATEFKEQSYGQMATYDIFFYQYNGYPTLHQNGGFEIRLNIPAGNYEIEARAPIYNNNTGKVWYLADLEFFLGNEARQVGETGQIGNTAEGRPYNLVLKTMACFNQTKTIRLYLGTSASSMIFTAFPSVTVKRVGGIRYAFD